MSVPKTDAAAPNQIFFDATLHPHRSLSPRAFGLLMLAAGTLMLGIGIIFMLRGAWPVMGFAGLEFLLLYVLFRLNYRAARAYERVQLTEEQLEVRRFSPEGEVGRWRFEPSWLQVSMDEPPRHGSQLVLSSHGRSLAIGAFLTPEERLQLAKALRDAITRWRNRWNSALAH